MWSGGPDAIGSVRPAGKWAQGLTSQTAKTPACHVQFVNGWFFIHGQFVNSLKISFSEQKFQITTSHFNFFFNPQSQSCLWVAGNQRRFAPPKREFCHS